MTQPIRGRRLVVRIVLLSVLPAIAVGAAFVATRNTPQRATQPAEHDHSQAVSDGPQAVMLSAESARRIGVTYAVASEEQLEREIRTVGQVTLDETRTFVIAPKVEGWVERLFADATGQEIAVGAPLMAVYSPMILAAQEELLLAARLSADLAVADISTRAQAASHLAASRSRLGAWDISPDVVARIEATGRTERTITVQSPVAGFVVEKSVVQGQRIMAGEPLFKVADLSHVWLEGEVYEQDLSVVRTGQVVRAEIPALPDETFSGRVAYVYPTLNAESRTARVRVELPNPGYRLKPGMIATLRFAGSTGARVLTIPRAAVLSTGERHLVFVKRADGMLEPRVVHVGSSTADRVAILRGLARGDTVVASATFLVDAESNLGTAMGGMGDMPGMDIVAPRKKRD